MAGQKRGHRPPHPLGGRRCRWSTPDARRGQKLRRCVQNPGLPPGTSPPALGSSLPGRLPPRNIPPGAGGIHQHPVEPAGKPLASRSGVSWSTRALKWPCAPRSGREFWHALGDTRCIPTGPALASWPPAGWTCRRERRTDPGPAGPAPTPAAPPGPWRWALAGSTAPPHARGAGRAAPLRVPEAVGGPRQGGKSERQYRGAVGFNGFKRSPKALGRW